MCVVGGITKSKNFEELFMEFEEFPDIWHQRGVICVI